MSQKRLLETTVTIRKQASKKRHREEECKQTVSADRACTKRPRNVCCRLLSHSTTFSATRRSLVEEFVNPATIQLLESFCPLPALCTGDQEAAARVRITVSALYQIGKFEAIGGEDRVPLSDPVAHVALRSLLFSELSSGEAEVPGSDVYWEKNSWSLGEELWDAANVMRRAIGFLKRQCFSDLMSEERCSS